MTNLTGRPIYQKGQSKPKKASKPMRRVSDRKAKESHPLRRSAKGEACTLRIPGVCKNDTSAVVLCHVRTPGTGMATKPLDMHGLYGCAECHQILDQRALWNKHELSWFHVLAAMIETQKKMVAKGLVFVKE